MSRTLCLNVTYEPLGFLSEERAVVVIYEGKAETIEESGRIYTSAGGIVIPVPSVIRLTRYIKVPRTLREAISPRVLFSRDQFTCQYCGKHEKALKGKNNRLTMDHIQPRSKGGPHHWENVVTACYHCNLRKRNRTPMEANMKFVHLYKDRSPKKPSDLIFIWGGKVTEEQLKWIRYFYPEESNGLG